MSRIVPKNDGQKRGGRNLYLGPMKSTYGGRIPLIWVLYQVPITALRLRTYADNQGLK